jgi:hypothetical protein
MIILNIQKQIMWDSIKSNIKIQKCINKGINLHIFCNDDKFISKLTYKKHPS